MKTTYTKLFTVVAIVATGFMSSVNAQSSLNTKPVTSTGEEKGMHGGIVSKANIGTHQFEMVKGSSNLSFYVSNVQDSKAEVAPSKKSAEVTFLYENSVTVKDQATYDGKSFHVKNPANKNYIACAIITEVNGEKMGARFLNPGVDKK